MAKKIKFNYTGKLDGGEIFDTSMHEEHGHPIEFEVGKGTIIPGLEKELISMKKGDKKEILVKADEAYGQPQENLVRELPKGPVPEGMKLEKGAVIYLKTPEGHPFPAKVVEVKEETVLLDLNHPLAGKDLTFEVEVVDISEEK
ncbi:peptidylprolyl isomerase [archaeon]|jgi:FKBP-type peptidyl-prolyl cis-trans isomerase 2|nr:peptidylprolyl isomerase [archaeon]MBT4022706.1 peptidylprolyl isomerase [archaeon]MBT4273100.1 peptidylprolyl isomerase [archaeon]MBT4461081.1 peptidylprolyl isomerase [archaeon]MBT4858750.1 peptidylprolyl isomerase [archaeon]